MTTKIPRAGTRYGIADIELTRPLQALPLAADETGVAVLLRRGGRPLGFFLVEGREPATEVPIDELSRLVAEHAGQSLVDDAIAAELGQRRPPPQPLPRRSRPSVTAAICTRDRPEDLRRCLRSLLAVRDAAGGVDAFEILVVENAPSSGATAAVIDGMPDVRRCLEPLAGLDFARNRALAEATGEVIAFLDDDVVVDAGWLGGLLEALAENPDAGCVTGLVLPAELGCEAQVIFERRGGFRRGCRKLRYSGPVQPGNPLYPAGAGIFGAGCNMAFKRQALVDLGGFDEALDTGPPLPGGGDLDAFYRVVRAGHPLVYEPSMLVFHRHRRDLEGLRRQYRSWGAGMMAFVAKTWTTDPSQRWKLERLVWWWVRQQLRELRRAAGEPEPVLRRMVFAELAGGVAGLAGTYPRSQRRSAGIRRQHRDGTPVHE